MCGIVGIVGTCEVAPLLVESVARLEYRDYDSCGLATLDDDGIRVLKDVGAVEDVAKKWDQTLAHGRLGIAHTRWATHGGIAQENAHPHLSCDQNFAVVHNGIISNHEELKTSLLNRGKHFFISDTDTEVIAHLMEETYGPGSCIDVAFVRILRHVEGTIAVALISRDQPEKIFCARQKSPLILGLDSGTNFVGSDINAFLPYTRRAILLDNGDYAVVSRDGYHIKSILTGEERYKQVAQIE